MPAAIEYFDRESAATRDFVSNLEKVGDEGWYELYRNKVDGRLWRIDKDDKYQQSYALQVLPGMDWKTYDPTPDIKALMLATRGESSTGRCMVAGCSAKPLNDLAFCVEHAFERGVRR
jgi:hypothetical protein